MNEHGFLRVAAAVPRVRVADCEYNSKAIIEQITNAEEQKVDVVVFPELCITGYTCGDLFLQRALLKNAKDSLFSIAEATEDRAVIAIVGLPLEYKSQLLNVAAVVQGGKVLGLVPKTYLPNYKEFYEMRWFTSGCDVKGEWIDWDNEESVPISKDLLFESGDVCFGIEICEDLWSPIPPSSRLALRGADVIFNLSADNSLIKKENYLRQLISQQSARCLAGYVFSSCGFGESTTDVVFGGDALIYENGTLLAEGKRFSLEPSLVIGEIDVEYLRNERNTNKTFAESIKLEKLTTTEMVYVQILSRKAEKLLRSVNPTPFVPSRAEMNERCEEIFNIQTMGLAKRMVHTGCKSLVVGISGGLDSTLALLVSAKTCDILGLKRTCITGITMPGFGTTSRTYQNALCMMQELGVTIREISIKDACIQHFKDISHPDGQFDVTYENSQARERTQILMDVANQTGGMVVGTGDLSELALGWATYNGDHMSMYAVNASIPKTLIRYLVDWVSGTQTNTKLSETLQNVLETPVSPELLPKTKDDKIAQKTEDIVGPYELHDFFLYNMVRCGFSPAKIYYLAQNAFADTYEKEVIRKWLVTFVRRFFNQQFKRSCLPDGPKVGSVSLSPRGDWRMPSDACSTLWLKEAESL